MRYSVLHISILIDVLLVKHNATQEENLIRNYEGLVALQKEIEFEVEKESSRSEKQYLYKLDDRLKKAIQSKEELITVKEVFVQNCISHLHYDSYKDFESRIDFIKKRLQKAARGNSQILFLLPEERKNRILGDVESAQKPDQDLQFIQQTYHINTSNWRDILLDKRQKQLIIWCLPYDSLQESEKELIPFQVKHKEQLTHVLPVFLYSKRQELDELKVNLQQENLLGYDGDLDILMQLLILYSLNGSQKTGDKTSSNISIQDANTVILGNSKVKGKYIIGGDMNIGEVKKL